MKEEKNQETPDTPTFKTIINFKDSKPKLKLLLNGTKLDDIPIDFLGTQHFADLYVMDRILGAGSFGVVLKVIEHSTGEEYAMKVLFFSLSISCFQRLK